MPKNKDGRLLVKDWSPVKPPRLSMALRFTGQRNPVWNQERKDWLRRYYPNATDDDLAWAMDCSVQEIYFAARRMRLDKSGPFIKWQSRTDAERLAAGGGAVGFHWETDEEYAERMKRLREIELSMAYRCADNFEFCTKEEKRALSRVLYEAIKWGRESTPEEENPLSIYKNNEFH